jgi:hypothetical protein
MSERELELEAIKIEAQKNLVNFLLNDIELAFTFLETAQISDNAQHVQALRQKSRTALASIRHFEGRVEDPEKRDAVRKGADRLEQALNTA